MVRTYAHRGEDNATLADLVIGRGLSCDKADGLNAVAHFFNQPTRSFSTVWAFPPTGRSSLFGLNRFRYVVAESLIRPPPSTHHSSLFQGLP